MLDNSALLGWCDWSHWVRREIKWRRFLIELQLRSLCWEPPRHQLKESMQNANKLQFSLCVVHKSALQGSRDLKRHREKNCFCLYTRFISFQCVSWMRASHLSLTDGSRASDTTVGPKRRQDTSLITATAHYSIEPQQRAWNPVKGFSLIGMTSLKSEINAYSDAAIILPEWGSFYGSICNEISRIPV